MEKRNTAVIPPRTVSFATRPSLMVSCPHCWTDQHAFRNRCWRCGAEFVFLDETKLDESPSQERQEG